MRFAFPVMDESEVSDLVKRGDSGTHQRLLGNGRRVFLV